MSDHVIVWDLETVPDTAGYAAANGLIRQSNEEIRESLGNKFPKHIYHSIACIGALIAHQESDCWVVDALGAPHVGERVRKIMSFVDRIAELTPQLVTFNGSSFDLPVLGYRAMTHSVRKRRLRNAGSRDCDLFGVQREVFRLLGLVSVPPAILHSFS